MKSCRHIIVKIVEPFFYQAEKSLNFPQRPLCDDDNQVVERFYSAMNTYGNYQERRQYNCKIVTLYFKRPILPFSTTPSYFSFFC